ncbi:hypothetical protein BC829DRAFT_173691 [Chytridium lagenaria]|nr:hypothetical protein BC829DRAFT_173691 [Chytridium lagenaria]
MGAFNEPGMKNAAPSAEPHDASSQGSKLPVAKPLSAKKLVDDHEASRRMEEREEKTEELMESRSPRRESSATKPLTMFKGRNLTPQHLLKELSRVSPHSLETLPSPPSPPAFSKTPPQPHTSPSPFDPFDSSFSRSYIPADTFRQFMKPEKFMVGERKEVRKVTTLSKDVDESKARQFGGVGNEGG